MAPIIQQPCELRCQVQNAGSPDNWIITVRPCRWEYGSLIVFAGLCAAAVWCAREVSLWQKGPLAWSSIILGALIWLGLSIACLMCVMVKHFRPVPGEFHLTNAILGIRRQHRFQSGYFELEKFYGSEDLKDEPFQMELKLIPPTRKCITLVRVCRLDLGFARTLSEFLARATGWKIIETKTYSPPVNHGSSV